ncbi:HLA-B associated transcript 5 [Capsaspora owczarzaki ATCC 30864]|uniref:HLA-B associated transcript 5 n=1 Tax=Capsaspora owczarzaki (strain ATCC 30864) TaxID=595528 RepID=A0A0D2X3A5_CAPO3|nr:HLA-B associated transcript 5 [Capsaspora owczarzaki ATCC 30864]KJE93969.1 HLA-B associated transcript 5 [Capsaspora owczarzaki ATCC 30864]|eukprot:XP_004347425.1 HLA-B associated transcript 5 [Capsaspora owczarzaki ATCC 30864]
MASTLLGCDELDETASDDKRRLHYIRFLVGGPVAPLYKNNGLERVSVNLSSAYGILSFVLRPMVIYRSISITWDVLVHGADWTQELYNLPTTTMALTVAAYVLALVFRGLGRYSNPVYREFMSVFRKAQTEKPLTSATRAALDTFDYDWSTRAADYEYVTSADESKAKVAHVRHTGVPKFTLAMIFNPRLFVHYMVATSIGIRAMYPGTTAPFKAMVGQMLCEGRNRLITTENGRRNKLLAADGNAIDTIFLDRRPASTQNGSVLVIACEGNGSFYEMGVSDTAQQLGYSVLGWNHPGYGASTGMPYPSAEKNAIDVVMQFALDKLGFAPQNILFYGWSIGGMTASHAASQHPGIRGVIIDASFDDMAELAPYHMPPMLDSLTRSTVRQYLHIQVAQQACNYDGPILLYRRADDEMMCNRRAPTLASNRGNHLLKAILLKRYPGLIHVPTLDRYLFECDSLEACSELQQSLHPNEIECNGWLAEEQRQHGSTPAARRAWGTGLSTDKRCQLTLHMVNYHLINIPTSHCPPLPRRMWREPWRGPDNSATFNAALTAPVDNPTDPAFMQDVMDAAMTDLQ